jgi:transcriptional regulator with XRE-family HTH domain
VAVPRFRPSVLLEARERAKLTQLQLAMMCEAAAPQQQRPPAKGAANDERARRVGAWESRVGAWERGIDAPSATYVPTLARVLDVEPLALFDVDLAAPPFTALRLAAGLTLQALAEATGISYTSLHRMVRGVSRLSGQAAEQLASTLGVTVPELVASIERDR